MTIVSYIVMLLCVCVLHVYEASLCVCVCVACTAMLLSMVLNRGPGVATAHRWLQNYTSVCIERVCRRARGLLRKKSSSPHSCWRCKMVLKMVLLGGM